MPAVRLATAVACIGLLATLVIFTRLGGDVMGGDESQYALATRTLLRTGNWLAPSPYPPELWFHKPPLYMWLSAAVAPIIPDSPLRYRFWSATFGVLSILGTAWLAGRWYSPTAGLLAGLVLLLNRDFVRSHGARDGTMDTGLTLLTLAAVATFGLAAGLARRPQTLIDPPPEGTDAPPTSEIHGSHVVAAWAAIGVFCGLMSLLKPLMGAPLWVLLSVSWAISPGRPGRGRYILAPLIGLTTATVVAGWWYLANYQMYGVQFIDGMFGQNMLTRLTRGIGIDRKPWWFYIEQLLLGQAAYMLSIPAILWAAYRGWRGDSRGGVLVIVTVGWLVLVSAGSGKFIHYVYPAVPMLAVLIGAMLAAGVFGVHRRSPKLAAVLVGGFVIASLGVIGSRFVGQLSHDRRPYYAWEAFRHDLPAVEAGQMRMVSVGFPPAGAEWRSSLQLEASDCYYLEPWVQRATPMNPEEYVASLGPASAASAASANSGSPTPQAPMLALVSKRTAVPDHPSRHVILEQPAYLIERIGGDTAGVPVPKATPSIRRPVLLSDERTELDPRQLGPVPAGDSFALRMVADSPSAANLVIDLDLPPEQAAGLLVVLRSLSTNRRVNGPDPLIATADGSQIFARLAEKDWQRQPTMDVRVQIRRADGAPANVHFNVIKTRLDLLPDAQDR